LKFLKIQKTDLKNKDMISNYLMLQEILSKDDLNAFINNYADYNSKDEEEVISHLSKTDAYEDIIDDAFNWENTDEGYGYWEDINCDYKRMFHRTYCSFDLLNLVDLHI